MDRAFLTPKEFVDGGRRTAAWALADSLAYTRWLARRHYENFHVVTFLLPKRLHQDFYNVYAYCRWADDLADEIGDTGRSLELLDWWRAELDALYAGSATHPVFVALAGTITRRQLPKQPFADLIRAFIQDQQVTRYQTLDDLIGYCRNSANPVGRLVLGLCGYSDAARQQLSDETCTGLQLANFWQDVSVDWEKDRIYMPLDVLARHGSGVEDIRDRRATPGFRAALAELVGVARDYFRRGLPLVASLDRRLAIDIDLFNRGGLRILDKIEAQDYDVLGRRPSVSKLERVSLLLASVVRNAWSPAGRSTDDLGANGREVR